MDPLEDYFIYVRTLERSRKPSDTLEGTLYETAYVYLSRWQRLKMAIWLMWRAFTG